MKIYEGNEWRYCEGITLCIDVLRAFTTSAYLLTNIYEVICTPHIELAYYYKHKGLTLFGEKGGNLIKGFHFDNSPNSAKNYSGEKKPVLRTGYGVKSLLKLTTNNQVTKIIPASFVNAKALDRFLSNQTDPVCALITGFKSKDSGKEDIALAHYLSGNISFDEAKKAIKESYAGSIWLKNKQYDVDLSINNQLDFIQSVKSYNKNRVVIKKEFINV